MKTNCLILLIFLFGFRATTGFCTIHTVSSGNNDFVFSPTEVNANVGDTIIFSLGFIHSALEVSQATWDANGNTGNGGFHIPFGGDSTVVTIAKIYYYICENHYSMGMKGTIVVTEPVGVKKLPNSSAEFEVFPNPVSSGATVKTKLPAGKPNQIRILDITGKCVLKRDNIAPVQYLDLSSFSKGIYLMDIRYEDVLLEKKIIVSR